MASSDDAHDPEWRLEGVNWDADAMEASTKDTGSGGAAPGRSPNTSCQVEGCCALLPLRSYYQRQHICEEHFRAMVVTEPSGRLVRFCQQCTKLEPLANFDGQRRSCRESLVRRNQRRQGRRTGARRGQAAKKAPASKPVAGAAGSGGSGAAGVSGSGDSTTRVARTASPSGATEASPPEEAPGSVQRSKRARRELDTSPPPLSVGYWLQPVAGPDSGAGSAAGSGSSPARLPAHLLGAIEQLEALEPVLAAPQLPPGAHASQLLPHIGHAAAHQAQLHPTGHHTHHPHGPHAGLPGAGAAQVTLAGMSASELGALANMDVDQLLASDSDQLADLLLAGSRTTPPAATATPAPAAAHAGWALPPLAPQQQAFYTLPATAALQLHAPHLAGMPAAGAPAGVLHAPLHTSQHPAILFPPAQATPLGHPAAGQLGAAAVATGAPAANDVTAFAASFFGDWPASLPEDAELDALLDCFEPLHDEVRLSLKLYGVHPDQLPPVLRAELLSALGMPPTPAQAAIRAGCVHLTLTALIDAEERRRLLAPGAAATVLARLLPLVQQLPARRAALQLGQGSSGSAALLAAPHGGGPAALLSLQPGQGSTNGVPPALDMQPPLATTVSACRGFFSLRCPRGLLWGADGLTALCRRAGTGHVPLSLALAGKQAAPQSPRGTSPDPEEDGWDSSDGETSDDEAEYNPQELVQVDAWVPFQPPLAEERGAAGPGGDTPLWQAGWGLYEFELARGTLLGPAVPVLVLPDAHAAAAAELARLPPGLKAATVLRLAALVLRYLEQREGATGPHAVAAFEARYPPMAVARLAAAARQLLSLAQRAGWPALAALVRPATIADGWHPARAALMAAPQLAMAAAAPTAAAQPAAGPPAAATPPAAQPAAEATYAAAAEQEAVHVVGTLLPPPVPTAAQSARFEASGSGDSPRKPGSSGDFSPSSKLPSAGSNKEVESQLPQLCAGDSLRRVMHPAVLCAASALVAGCVLGVGWALGAGYL